MSVLAGREELTEDLLEHAEVFDVAAGDGREGFIEQHHAFFVAVAVHQAGAEVGQGHELQVCIGRLLGNRQCFAKVRLLRRSINVELP